MMRGFVFYSPYFQMVTASRILPFHFYRKPAFSCTLTLFKFEKGFWNPKRTLNSPVPCPRCRSAGGSVFRVALFNCTVASGCPDWGFELPPKHPDARHNLSIRLPIRPQRCVSRPACPIPSQPPTGSRRRAQARPGAPCTGSFSPSTCLRRGFGRQATPRPASRPPGRAAAQQAG
jgi:hypothetical protein